MSLNNLTIACLGLGRMGAGIARNIQASGCRLVVYNRTPEKMQLFVVAGAKAARTAREASSSADIVITSLMDDQSVIDTLSGETIDTLSAQRQADENNIGDAVCRKTDGKVLTIYFTDFVMQ